MRQANYSLSCFLLAVVLQVPLCSPVLSAPVSYSYDALNRLTEMNYNNGQQIISYTYDAAGNMLTRTVSEVQGPLLSVTAPVDGAYINIPLVSMSGTATDAGVGDSGIASVTVNAVPATGGTATGAAIANWSIGLALTSGPNTFTVIATDNSAYANQTFTTVTLTYIPFVIDTDGDSLDDTFELAIGTDPTKKDTDGDGINDGQEISHDGDATNYNQNTDTNPLNSDTDGDGFTDLEEIAASTDPLDPASYPYTYRVEFNAVVTGVSVQQNLPTTIYVGQAFNGYVDMDTSLAPIPAVTGNSGDYDIGPANQNWIAEAVTLGGVTYTTSNYSATSGQVQVDDAYPSTSTPDALAINSAFDNNGSGQFALVTSLIGDQMPSHADFITGYDLKQRFIWNLEPDNLNPLTGTFTYADDNTASSRNVDITFKLLRAQASPVIPTTKVDLSGTIKTDTGLDICAMVLASGQYMFSCNPIGDFSLAGLPREPDGTVKRQIYADGFLPKINVLTGTATSEAVMLENAGTCTSYNMPYSPGTYPGSAGTWIDISGNVYLQNSSTPICAMVLANGQYMFSCDGSGSYNLHIPLDADGQFKMQVYADGFAPSIQYFDEYQTNNTVKMARASECQVP